MIHSARDLAKLLNNNGGALLDSIPLEAITEYDALKTIYLNGDIIEDEAFQKKFCERFHISGTGVNKEFLERYFEILEAQKKREGEVDFRLLARAVYGSRPKRKLTSSQFSFLSAFAHFVHDEHPVYNNNVARIFEFDPPTQARLDSRERLNVYMEFYDGLADFYHEMVEEDMIRQLLAVFKIKLKDYGDYKISPTRRANLLVTHAADLHNSGKLIW